MGFYIIIAIAIIVDTIGCFFFAAQSIIDTIYMIFLFVSVIHVPIVPIASIHSLIRHMSSGHKTAKLIVRPRDRSVKIM